MRGGLSRVEPQKATGSHFPDKKIILAAGRIGWEGDSEAGQWGWTQGDRGEAGFEKEYFLQ